MKINNKPILLVEDDSVDVMTILRALKEIHVVNPVVNMEHGEAALDHLRNPANERPCIILLDLNMPIMNGIEFLQQAKQDAMLRSIPVVVLTTSEEQQDKVRSFDLGVAGYMAKPVDYRRFVEVMRSIDLYWTLSEMP
jgi:CheY-like chemotaxis protein